MPTQVDLVESKSMNTKIKLKTLLPPKYPTGIRECWTGRLTCGGAFIQSHHFRS